MKVNDPRCNGGACARGRANSSAAAAIVIWWQAAAPYEVLHKKQKLEAAANGATYSMLQVAAAVAAALQQPLTINRISTARGERLLPNYGELYYSSLPTSPRLAIRS